MVATAHVMYGHPVNTTVSVHKDSPVKKATVPRPVRLFTVVNNQVAQRANSASRSVEAPRPVVAKAPLVSLRVVVSQVLLVSTVNVQRAAQLFTVVITPTAQKDRSVRQPKANVVFAERSKNVTQRVIVPQAKHAQTDDVSSLLFPSTVVISPTLAPPAKLVTQQMVDAKPAPLKPNVPNIVTVPKANSATKEPVSSAHPLSIVVTKQGAQFAAPALPKTVASEHAQTRSASKTQTVVRPPVVNKGHNVQPPSHAALMMVHAPTK